MPQPPSATQPGIDYLGIDHLGIAVADLEAASETYATLLGLPATGAETLSDRGIEVRFFDTGNARIELLGATHEASEISGFLAKRGPGIHHLCLAVADIDTAVAGLRQRGARLVGQGIQAGAHGTRVAFVHPKSSHGVLLELVERAHTANPSPRKSSP